MVVRSRDQREGSPKGAESKIRVHRLEVHNNEPGTRKNWTTHCSVFFLMFDNNIQTYFTYHPVTRLKCTLTEFSCIYSYINLMAINFRTFHHPQTFYSSNSKSPHSQKTSTLCLALAGLDIHINRILGSLSCLLSPRTIVLLSVHGFVPMFHAYYGQIIFHHVSNTGFCLSIQVIRELFPV